MFVLFLNTSYNTSIGLIVKKSNIDRGWSVTNTAKVPGEVVLATSGNGPEHWLVQIVERGFYKLLCRQLSQIDGAGVSELFGGNTQAIILKGEFSQLGSATQNLNRQAKCPVLWAVDHLDEQVIESAVTLGASGVLSAPQDPLAGLCTLRMAMETWRRESKYRSMADHAQAKLESRKTIEKAKGILMDRYGLPESVAYQRIRQEAMNRRKRMVQVAESILLTEQMKVSHS
ncbi:ANTAR domain-containing response regulator [Effusibacillus lacus]|uniref:ANTAR domain-containing protein n=1 Tax=Effusibacillus lacus TaxID=1348429 RepID=A0A292YSF5_9BACL|nr:ANTAR domain-containing protein [Effusibacillus lacus]TCS76069.1 ANTAR domain-containing protein [Effusibacillus lacus]GAX91415.1 hypothetical protein EFBL_3084 [Effusibacillus lacus]